MKQYFSGNYGASPWYSIVTEYRSQTLHVHPPCFRNLGSSMNFYSFIPTIKSKASEYQWNHPLILNSIVEPLNPIYMNHCNLSTWTIAEPLNPIYMNHWTLSTRPIEPYLHDLPPRYCPCCPWSLVWGGTV
jgi:hypothetical protein